MKNVFTLLLVVLSAVSMQAQGLPRLFLDIPHIYFSAPDVENINNLMGVGTGAAFNVGTHWGVARIGGGADFTVDPKSNDIGDSFQAIPYGLFEAGVGVYRSNGNKCARTHHGAFTAMGKCGARYRFDTRDIILADDRAYGADFTVGAEFGYFYIRDIFKNYEFSMSADYYTQAKILSVSAGFKLFLNLRANR